MEHNRIQAPAALVLSVFDRRDVCCRYDAKCTRFRCVRSCLVHLPLIWRQNGVGSTHKDQEELEGRSPEFYRDGSRSVRRSDGGRRNRDRSRRHSRETNRSRSRQRRPSRSRERRTTRSHGRRKSQRRSASKRLLALPGLPRSNSSSRQRSGSRRSISAAPRARSKRRTPTPLRRLSRPRRSLSHSGHKRCRARSSIRQRDVSPRVGCEINTSSRPQGLAPKKLARPRRGSSPLRFRCSPTRSRSPSRTSLPLCSQPQLKTLDAFLSDVRDQAAVVKAIRDASAEMGSPSRSSSGKSICSFPFASSPYKA